MTSKIDYRANLSYETFAHEYLFTNKPVVITDALRSWKSLTRWTPEFFRSEFGQMTFTLNENSGQNASYEGNVTGREYTMASFIDRVLESTDESPAPYFRNRVL